MVYGSVTIRFQFPLELLPFHDPCHDFWCRIIDPFNGSVFSWIWCGVQHEHEALGHRTVCLRPCSGPRCLFQWFQCDFWCTHANADAADTVTQLNMVTWRDLTEVWSRIEVKLLLLLHSRETHVFYHPFDSSIALAHSCRCLLLFCTCTAPQRVLAVWWSPVLLGRLANQLGQPWLGSVVMEDDSSTCKCKLCDQTWGEPDKAAWLDSWPFGHVVVRVCKWTTSKP